MPRRIERLNEQLKRELAVLLRTGLRDPRVGTVTVTGVRTTADLDRARVRVRILGSDEEKRLALEGLEHAAPFLRTSLSQVLSIRRVPELHFEEDLSLERAARIEELLSEVRPEGGWTEAEEETADPEGADGEPGSTE